MPLVASSDDASLSSGCARGRFAVPALAVEAWHTIVARYEAERLPLGGIGKRCLDLVVALSALVVLLPLLLMVSVLIRATMGGPVVFTHESVGFRGRRMRCYKFRTMVNNSDEVLKARLLCDPSLAGECQESRQLRTDQRVTALGTILRKSSIDELPQLINVIRGEMSCVGPRPVTVEELARYGQASADYLGTRPGLTGLWQLSGRNRLSDKQRVALDSRYVNQWSTWADLVIMARTIPAVLSYDETS